MQRLTVPTFFAAVLAATLLVAGVLGAQAGAQAPGPDATVQAPPQAGLPGGGDLLNQKQLTPEEQLAQTKAQAAHMQELQAQAFARHLGMSPMQLQQLRPILAERQKQLHTIMSADGRYSPEQRAKAVQIQADTQARIKAILTPEQKDQYDRLIAARDAQRSRRSAAKAAAPAKRPAGSADAPASEAAPATAPETTPAPAPENAPAPAPETAPAPPPGS